MFLSFAFIIKAQTYSYEIKMDNFQQINETEFQFDISLRKGTGSSDFALYSMQCRWSYNAAVVNGGSFQTDYLTIVGGSNPTGTQLYQKAGWFSDNDFTRISSTQLGWATVSIILGNGDQITVIDATWRKVARFSVKLRNTANTAMQNFADVDPQFAFETSGINLIVRRCDGYTGSNPTATMVGNGNSEVSTATRVVTPALGVAVNTRELAGYYFTGTAGYTTAANWNNVTTANYHTVPGSLNNAIIAGSTTVSDTRIAKDVTVASGGYLVVSPTGKYTANNMYNDNTGSGGGTATIAGWDFQTATPGTNQYPYKADYGITGNIGISPLNTTATKTTSFDFSSTGGTIAPRANLWFYQDPDTEELFYYDWNIQFSTLGYQNLKVSSKQRSPTTGPLSFKLQWSTNGTVWNDVTNGTINVNTTWSSGVLSNLDLPSDLFNKSTVYLRWLNTSVNGTGSSSAIDDIYITGDALPTGINIQSTSGSTGSLIHNTTGVNATIQRYIGGWSDANHGWHFLSSPVAAQPISVFHTAGSGNDFYKWDEGATDNKKWINRTGSTGQLNPDFETNFAVGLNGYLIANATTTTPVFTGEINVSNVAVTGLTNHYGTAYSGWHLLGNPFASALKFNQGSWNRVNVSPIAQIWNQTTASYKVLRTAMEIPAMNGFMVYTTGSGSLTIPADARVHSDSVWYKQAATEEKITLVANDPDGQTAQETIIAFDNNATEGFDFDFDSYYMSGFAPAFFSKSNGKNFAWNTLPLLTGDRIIPLSFTKNSSTHFNITITEKIPGINIFLRDLKLNTDQDLSRFPVYSFSSEQGDDANRFELHFSGVGMNETVKNRPVSIYSFENTLNIISNTTLPVTGKLMICNMMGQNILVTNLGSELKTTISLNYPQGYYLVKLITLDGSYTEKVFIK